MTATRRRGWLGRNDRAPGTDEADHTHDEAAGSLWTAHEHAHKSATHLVETSAQILASSARQQAIIDGLAELARNAAGRGAEVEEPLERIAMVLDRLRLVALNVGLEGARLGDPAGRALMNVADEVRGHSERGAEAMQDLRDALEELDPAWRQVAGRAEELRESHAAIVAQVGQQQNVAQQVVQQVHAVGQHARSLCDSDPETARILEQAGEHARGLIQALGSLGGRARRELVRSALGPSLQPLLRVLLDVAKGSRAEKDAE